MTADVLLLVAGFAVIAAAVAWTVRRHHTTGRHRLPARVRVHLGRKQCP